MPYLFFYSPTQLSQRLQCEARGGRKILQVKQYFSFTVCPLMITSFVLGGGRYPPELEPFAISKHENTRHEMLHMSYDVCTKPSLMAIYSLFQILLYIFKINIFPPSNSQVISSKEMFHCKKQLVQNQSIWIQETIQTQFSNADYDLDPKILAVSYPLIGLR